MIIKTNEECADFIVYHLVQAARLVAKRKARRLNARQRASVRDYKLRDQVRGVCRLLAQS